MSRIAPDRLADVFVEVADTLVEEFDLIEFLQTVTTRAVELTGASAAGLLLADHNGHLQFMAASDESSRLLELFQLQNHEGPCLEAYRTGNLTLDSDLGRASERWPRFAPQATATGYRSVHAFPLRLRSTVIGALNIFSTHMTELDPADAKIVQAFGDIATIAILQERTLRHSETVTEQLQVALNSRVILEQAKGALAQMLDTDVDQAFETMRTYARQRGRRLSEIARAIVTDPTSEPDLTQTRP